MNEFEIIEKFFNQQTITRKDVIVGIGDDCAIVNPEPNQHLAITTDTLVAGVHFEKNAAAYDIGFKSLAVNLSDLAAAGATPAWITLALTLPEADQTWLTEFARGLFTLAARYRIQLIGGDLTRGPLAVTIQAMGFVPAPLLIRRSGAKAGDLIYVTHTLGDAALALAFTQNKIAVHPKWQTQILKKLHQPEPQIALSEKLRGLASAAIDISDGLAADLTHILTASQVGAVIYLNQLPLSDALRETTSQPETISYAINGGDDYELCFTVPENRKAEVPSGCTCIGKIVAAPGLDLQFADGTKYNHDIEGYKHFKD